MLLTLGVWFEHPWDTALSGPGVVRDAAMDSWIGFDYDDTLAFCSVSWMCQWVGEWG